MRTCWQFQAAGQLVFGTGALQQLGHLLKRQSLASVMIVSDPQLQRAGAVAAAEAPLREAGIRYEIFAGGRPEPTIEVAEQAVEQARRQRPDAIIGLGGGSNMDLAKMVAVVATHGGSPSDYFGFGRVPGPVIPLVCIPTTAGTGSEVSHAAVLTDQQHQLKVSTLSPYLRPLLALVDPVLSYSCPPQVTADSGIDALTHAIEALTAVDYRELDAPANEPVAYEGAHPLGACLAAEAIRLVGQHLVTAVHHGQDERAREGMSLAATLAGMAFASCGVALVHALEYPIGGALHCSHGAGNGLLLPYVMRYNLPARTELLARVAQLLGAPTHGLTHKEMAELAIATVEQLRRQIGIPQRLREIGARREQLPTFAAKAFAIKRLMQTNPRRPTEQDLLQILLEAY